MRERVAYCCRKISNHKFPSLPIQDALTTKQRFVALRQKANDITKLKPNTLQPITTMYQHRDNTHCSPCGASLRFVRVAARASASLRGVEGASNAESRLPAYYPDPGPGHGLGIAASEWCRYFRGARHAVTWCRDLIKIENDSTAIRTGRPFS